MTDIAELHAQALDATGRVVRGVPADRWHAPTPCADWDAHALVNHLVSGNLWAADVFPVDQTAVQTGYLAPISSYPPVPGPWPAS
jgi:uncharacterized protein (TIGR03083 family)